MAETIGVIAGLGRLPHALTHSAKRQGARVVVIRALPGAFEEARDMGADEVCDIFIGQWGQVVSTLKAHGVGRAFLVGKISRECFFGEGSFDRRFQEIVAQLGERKNDDAGINGFVADLAREGIVVGNQAEYLAHLSTEPGVLGVRVPTPEEWRDLVRGYEVAKALAGLDVGQTAVVKDGAVLAVEAVDGTDRTIARGLELGKGGGVVVKVAKPQQDPRFDVPVIGPETVETVIRGKGAVLAFDAHVTLVLDLEQCIELADRHGISLVSYVPGMEGARH